MEINTSPRQAGTAQTVLDFSRSASSPPTPSSYGSTSLINPSFPSSPRDSEVWSNLQSSPNKFTIIELPKATHTFGCHEERFISKISEVQPSVPVISGCKSAPFLQIFNSDSNAQVVSLFLKQ